MHPAMTLERIDHESGDSVLRITVTASRRAVSNIELSTLFNAQKEGIPYESAEKPD